MLKYGYYTKTKTFVIPPPTKRQDKNSHTWKPSCTFFLNPAFWKKKKTKQFFLLFSISLIDRDFLHPRLDLSCCLLPPSTENFCTCRGYWHHSHTYNLRSTLGHRTWQTSDS